MVRSVRLARAAAIVVALIACAAVSQAQQVPAPTPSLAASPSPVTAPSSSPAPSPAAAAAATPSPTPGAAPSQDTKPSPDAGNSGDSAAMGETVDLVSQPAAYLEAKADRDDVYSAILGAIGKVRAEIAKAGLKAVGPPIAIFLEADDSGFTFRAAVPIELGAGGQDPAFRLGEARSDADRQGDALRVSQRLRRHRRDL